MTDTLHQEPKKDGFTHETPIRAFTTFTVDGLYALGKGFRPSLQHLMPYLNAMEQKEGWRLVQILEAFSQTPSFVFRKEPSVEVVLQSYSLRDIEHPALRDPVMPEVRTYLDQRDPGDEDPSCDDNGKRGRIDPEKEKRAIDALEKTGLLSPQEALDGRIFANNLPADDPVNPKHYKGTGCAEIAENLPANLAHAITYIWRAGDKPDQPELQELDKALWWMDRETNRARYLDAMDGEEDDDDCAPADMLAKGQAVFFDLRSYPIRHKKMARTPVRKHGFYRFAAERMEAAKLSDWKAFVVRAMVLYAIDRKFGALKSAIDHTKQRRGAIYHIPRLVPGADIGRGRGLEP